uniref:Mitochondrial elongation factor 2 n=1 Tax=Neogobius melanostomus TaxID=47308 RepID=A0A8C6UJU9_9GOBI
IIFAGYKKAKREDGITTVINFLLSNTRLVLGVGGAAILGIATLVVKRVSSLNHTLSESWEEISRVSASPTLLRKGLEGVVLQHVSMTTKQLKGKPDCGLFLRCPLCLLLQERLQQFYHTRAALSPQEVQRAKALALDICTEIQGFLHSRHPDMPLGEMSLGGSLLDDLQVVSADHACLLVPLQLESSLWRLIPGEETLLTHPLHWMVRRVNLEYFPRGRSYWDRHLVGGYLSSEAIVNFLSKSVMETMNWPSVKGTMDCVVRPVLGGADQRLEIQVVREGDASGDLFISMLPVLREGDATLSAQPELTSPWGNAWHLSLYPWETQRLAQLDAADGGCRRLLLKTLKAVCRLNPALRPLRAAPLPISSSTSATARATGRGQLGGALSAVRGRADRVLGAGGAAQLFQTRGQSAERAVGGPDRPDGVHALLRRVRARDSVHVT